MTTPDALRDLRTVVEGLPTWDKRSVPGGMHVNRAAVLALIPEGAVLVTDADLAILAEAHAIGSVSYDGDSWFAADAGYGYDEAEATMQNAADILARLRDTPASPDAE